jgi:hypothetical protein
LVAFGGTDARTGEPFDEYLTSIIEDEQVTHITPITTILQTSLEDEQINQLSELKSKLATVKQNLATLLDLKQENLTKDPIALALNGNKKLLQRALQIHKASKGMTKSLKQSLRKSKRDVLKSYKALAKEFRKAKKSVGTSVVKQVVQKALNDDIYDESLAQNSKNEVVSIVGDIGDFFDNLDDNASSEHLTNELKNLENDVVKKDRTDETNHKSTLSDTILVGDEYVKSIQSSLDKPQFSLSSNDDITGMSINKKTGMLYFSPTPNQVGNKLITITMEENTTTETTTLSLSIENKEIENLDNALFFAPNATDDKNNLTPTYENPALNTKWICKNEANYEGKTIFYFRGGTYTNPDFGSSLNTNSIPSIECSGTKSNPIVIKPWRNEKVKIKFDSAYGLKIYGNYLHLEGFEIEGVAQDINYTTAVNNWWRGDSYFNGMGLSYAGVGITIKDNVIHDVPGAGMNSKGSEVIDDLTIRDNIIFNASWWNIGGTTALGIVGSNKASGSDTVEGENIVIKDNLIFSSESRIFSRVFSKGFSHLIIDEGSTMLLKQYKGSYKGSYDRGFLVQNNFFLFNGKGVSLRWNDISFINNTFYNNGTTIAGGAGAFRSNGGTNLTIKNNAVYAGIDGTNAVDFSPDVTLKSCQNNLFFGGFSSAGSCEVGQSSSSDMFEDVTINNFTLKSSSNIGANNQTLSNLKSKLYNLGYKLAPANYKLDINGTMYSVNTPQYYKKQQQDIVRLAKQVEGFVSIEATNKDGGASDNDYHITFTNKNNVTGKKDFYLKID